MDIHKPKSWHSWRELVKEVGTIVIGILIALGLEQTVETLHEQKIADEARETIRAEVRENLWWMERRESREQCVHERLDKIGRLLDLARDDHVYAPLHDFCPLVHAKLTSLRWEANAQAGRASLFSAEEQRDLGNMYYSTDQFRRAQDLEEEAWSKLGAVEGLDHLTPSEIESFRILLSQVRYEDQSAMVGIRRAHQWAARLHLSADNPNQFEVPGG